MEDTEGAAVIGENVEGDGAAQAIGIKKWIKEGIDDFNDAQELVTAMVDGGFDDALIVGLQLAAERLSSKLGGVHKHHSDPKWAGGDPRQNLTRMWQGGHEQLHRDMNEFLDQFGMRPKKGNPGRDILDRFGRNAVVQRLGEFYKKYGQRYGQAAKDFFNQHPDL